MSQSSVGDVRSGSALWNARTILFQMALGLAVEGRRRLTSSAGRQDERALASAGDYVGEILSSCIPTPTFFFFLTKIFQYRVQDRVRGRAAEAPSWLDVAMACFHLKNEDYSR